MEGSTVCTFMVGGDQGTWRGRDCI